MMMRSGIPAADHSTYLNSGAAGPLTRAACEAISSELEWEFMNGRVGNIARERFFSGVVYLKDILSRFLNCAPHTIALTESTTVGLNIAIWGLNLKSGDAILTTASEHMGALAGLIAVQNKTGATIQMYQQPEFNVSDFFAHADSSTKAVLISHVSWQTGELLPIAEICAEAHSRGLVTIVDGAQAVGAVPVDLAAINADFYAFPAQKWTLGPEGIGGLYVADRVIERATQTFAGPFSFTAPDEMGLRHPSVGASRFEIGTRFRGTVQGWSASLRWIEQAAGWSNVFERTAAARLRLCELLSHVRGLTVLEPASAAGLVTIDLPFKTRSDDVVSLLDLKSVKIRSIPGGNRIRASTAFFNDDDDLMTFVEELSRIVECA